jgi:HEAT repeat protein
MLVSNGGAPASANFDAFSFVGFPSIPPGAASSDSEVDVAALLAAARGAPPAICSLAADAVRGYGWGDWSDAPSTPLPRTESLRRSDRDGTPLPAADIQRLLEALGSDDACVRELSVRVLGHQDGEPVVSGLLSRLRSNDAPMREVAALGLGLVEPAAAVDPLIQSLRDATPGVRANSVWALGRIENGRALAPIITLFRDPVEIVRQAAVVAAGRMDSTNASAALMRVVKQDEAASVRRVAAWALGELEARDAVEVLAGVLAQDKDARVREMSAWALGNIEDRGATSALMAAAKRETDDRVRESVVWALGQIEDRTSADVLGSVVSSDKSAKVRGTAAWALGQIEGDDGGRAPAGLLQALKDESEDVRLKAAWALGQIGDSSALPAIRSAVKQEKNERVGRAMIRALMKSGERSETTLTELLNSNDPQVREAAVRGLAGGGSFNPWPWPEPRPRPFPYPRQAIRDEGADCNEATYDADVGTRSAGVGVALVDERTMDRCPRPSSSSRRANDMGRERYSLRRLHRL